LLKHLFLPVQAYLEETQKIFVKSCKIKAGNLNSFTNLNFSPVELLVRPALVIVSANMFGPVTDQILNLAAMFKFIYIASNAHKSITENGNRNQAGNNLPNGCQFPILIGDYFYSNSFYMLCRSNLLKYLRELSGLVGDLNEVSISRLRDPDNPKVIEDFIKKDYASVYALGCKMGAELSGAGEQEIRGLYHYGFELGMANGLQKGQIYPEKVSVHNQKAMDMLKFLPEGTARKILYDLAGSLLDVEVCSV